MRLDHDLPRIPSDLYQLQLLSYQCIHCKGNHKKTVNSLAKTSSVLLQGLEITWRKAVSSQLPCFLCLAGWLRAIQSLSDGSLSWWCCLVKRDFKEYAASECSYGEKLGVILTPLWENVECIVYWLSDVLAVLPLYKEDVMCVSLSNLTAEKFV